MIVLAVQLALLRSHNAHKKPPAEAEGDGRPSRGNWLEAEADQPNLPEVEAIRKAA
ncbi:MAG: hypothetical protein RLZZ631_338 [Cyanobacteriota bacterium]